MDDFIESRLGGRIYRVWIFLRYQPGDWWFVHISQRPVSRRLRARRRALRAERARRGAVIRSWAR
ncbi:hypothetical protein [Kitasatospora sp. NPDC059827]|uniref:hypothetical protein n=1 Tax=Kitasatospora sp. NPDC059827 TaxID=3346964 RepID=UPI00366404E2